MSTDSSLDIQWIELTNFRVFQSAKIELKPITLLYGPNSSGKSSLLKALMFMRESIRNSPGLLHPAFQSRELDLGDFTSLVHSVPVKIVCA